VALLWIGLEAETRPPAPEPIPALRPSSAPARSAAPLATPAADELARLREENEKLRARLRAEEETRTAVKEELADALHELAELRRPMEIDMASATLRAQLRPGEGVVTGGYRLPDGSRLFAFIETDERADGGIGVMGRFYSVPDELARGLGLQNLHTEAANTLQHGEVWMREEIDGVTAQIQRSGAARAVGLGATALLPGNASVVRIESTPPISYRVYIDRDAGKGLDLDLRLESVPAEAGAR
jgi:hypothetical protein